MFLLLFVLQFVHATEKDSIHYRNRFAQYRFDFDDCDACGCSASGGSMGFSSMLNSNFIGIRYFNQQYKTTDGLYSNSPGTAKATIPRSSGRVSLFIKTYKYRLWYPTTTTRAKPQPQTNRFRVWAISRFWPCTGFSRRIATAHFGAYLASGRRCETTNGQIQHQQQRQCQSELSVGYGQLGLSARHRIYCQAKAVGLNTMLNYVIKTENGKWYRFGNQFNYAGTFSGFMKKARILLRRNWAAGEVYASNHQYTKLVRDTSGDIVLENSGLNSAKQLVVWRQCHVTHEPKPHRRQVDAQSRWSVNLNYSL
jgi:hypothetical protein